MKTKHDYSEELNFYGWTTPFSGYGIVALEYMASLNKLTGDKLSVGWQRRDGETTFELNSLTPEQRYLVAEKPFTKARIGIIKTTPDLFVENKSDIKIGYTMVENTKVGKKWVDCINGMDACFVPSKYLLDVFKESGVTVPLYQVKQGINPQIYSYYDRPPKNTFVFGTCGWLDQRKNWKEMITAFSSEFEEDEPVQFWLKNSNSDTFGWERPADPRVKFIDEIWTFEQMSKFYKDLDCFVFASRAEGAGMPPREAMATGLPTILTNWSGLADIANEKYNYPIDPVSIDVDDYRGDEQPGKQAKVDIQEIMYWMRYIYEHRNEAKIKGKAASDWMHKEWTWDVCASEILDILEKEFNYK